MFDYTVIWFGTMIENKLQERDKQFQPIHKLEDLLRDEEDQAQTLQDYIESTQGNLFGFMSVIK